MLLAMQATDPPVDSRKCRRVDNVLAHRASEAPCMIRILVWVWSVPMSKIDAPHNTTSSVIGSPHAVQLNVHPPHMGCEPTNRTLSRSNGTCRPHVIHVKHWICQYAPAMCTTPSAACSSVISVRHVSQRTLTNDSECSASISLIPITDPSCSAGRPGMAAACWYRSTGAA